ncbi:MAG: aminoacyl-tRNA hydrolase [Pirellulaceae bacterium]|nr:aminoacyl-tRNA hydrolase [Pirellulaceae bacterium]
MLRINSKISIPASELKFTYSRSPGPGGQNVNKVNTKATLNWDLTATAALPPEVMQRFQQQNQTRISREGSFFISSHRHRDQPSNTDDCLEKLRDLILKALVVPKRRKPTKPSNASKRRRLDSKRKTSDKKTLRRQPGSGE